MLEALAALARERPGKPVEFLANYLEEHNMERTENQGDYPAQAQQEGAGGDQILGKMNAFMNQGEN